MTRLINTFEAQSCPAVWLDAVRFLRTQPGRRAYNIVLGVASPLELKPSDVEVHDLVDAFLRAHDQDPLATVAGTIFPANHYMASGPQGVYNDYADAYPKFRELWGTYAYRMIRKQAKQGDTITTINPLETIVNKMRSQQKKGHFKAVYEMNLIEGEDFFELPTYDAALDCNRILPHPCLSHLSFKVLPKGRVMLTVLYRSHFYVLKALGNLLGLSQLLFFVAQESGLEMGPLICHSTSAVLDTDKWKVKEVDELVNDCTLAYSSPSASGAKG